MDSEETSRDCKTSPKPFELSNSQVQLSSAPFESSTFEHGPSQLKNLIQEVRSLGNSDWLPDMGNVLYLHKFI